MFSTDPCLCGCTARHVDEQLCSRQVAHVATEHESEFAVFAERFADERGVTSMVSLGRLNPDGALSEPIPMSLDQCDELIAALLAAKSTAATTRKVSW